MAEDSLEGDGSPEGRPKAAGIRGCEMGTNTSLSPLYAYSPKGTRAYAEVPRNRGKNTTLLASMSLGEGMGPCLAVEGATSATIFESYAQRVLAPTLKRLV